MMPIRGLDPKDIVLPKKVLSGQGGSTTGEIYFSAIALSMWDNIHGPKILQVWLGSPPEKQPRENPQLEETDQYCKQKRSARSTCSHDKLEDTLTSSTELSDTTLLSVANYTLNDEAARAETIQDIESKFYSLTKFKLIVYTNIFTITLTKGRTEVFSFMLLLPMSESSEFLARYTFCDLTSKKLLQEQLIRPLIDSNKERRDNARGSIRLKVDEVLKKFDDHLYKFTQTMLTLKQNPLPEKITLANTFLGKDATKSDIRPFLTTAITSHLQTSGYTIVLGSDRVAINKMILTLSLFLSPKERKMSRLICDSEEQPHYEANLFLQGLIWNHRKGQLPFTKSDLYNNKLPHTIIYMDEKHVSMVEPKVNVYIGRQEGTVELLDRKHTQKSTESSNYCSMREFKDAEKEMMSPIVKEFLSNLWMLNSVGGQRETFIAQFLRLLKLKALALAKYLDTESKPVSNLEIAADVLALRGNHGNSDKHRINLSTLQQDLAIDFYGDLHVILSFTEKIRPRTYIDVLGDPQFDNLAVIQEFASL